MLEVSPTLVIPDTEFKWSYARSGGPGGQNVNKVATKAVLHWDVTASPSLAEAVKARFLASNQGRITTEGVVVVTSERTRSQSMNRQDCLDILAGLLREALKVARRRKKTRPTRASKERRLEAKKHRARAKSQRRGTGED
jgi:ribosome-associated protein